jgi:hypothetical protein
MKRLLTIVVTAALWTSPVHAATLYLTTLNLATPIVNSDGIDEVRYSWSTSLGAGVVTELDLVDLTMTLLSGGVQVYQDVVLVGGVLQPIGGGPRVLVDVYWQFDLASMTLLEMRNANGPFGAASGTQYVVDDFLSLPVDARVGIARYVNGQLTASNEWNDHVRQQGTAVPEPGTLWVFAAAFGAAGLRRRFNRR